MKSLALSLSILLVSSVGASELPLCKNSNSKLTHLENGKVVYWKDAICSGLNDYPIISENCRKRSDCDALRAYQSAPKGLPMSGIAKSNPYHARCSKLGGVPVLVNISEKSESKETAICFFKRDRSFVSVFSKTGR